MAKGQEESSEGKNMFILIVMLILQMYFMLCYSVTKLCLTLCDPIDCSTSGSFALRYLLEFAQMHVCRVGDAI